MVSYGYTLDHIAPKRLVREGSRLRPVKPFAPVICAAVILGTSVGLWVVVFEAVKRIVL
jgi:hypothetical protein